MPRYKVSFTHTCLLSAFVDAIDFARAEDEARKLKPLPDVVNGKNFAMSELSLLLTKIERVP